MRRNNKLAVAVAAAGVLISGLVVAADIPGDKAVISMDQVAGKKGAVEFQHTRHATEFKKVGGVAIECTECHHTLASNSETPKPCGECHAPLGAAEKMIDGKAAPVMAVEKKPGKIDQKSILYHMNCVDGCHKAVKKAEGKKITACKVCPPKEK